MPTLDWTGKQDAIEFTKRIPYRLLEYDSELSCGDGDNLIVQGDNLDALHSLLPFYRGRVKCVYIDPPYNTGSAFEHYDDNLEHATWLSMMYPRLELLREFLSDDGAIFISIDDNEQAYLKVICDEIFGRNNFVANISWEKRYTRSNNAKMFYSIKDSILVYRKSDALSVIKESRTDKANANYSNPDNDPRGAWMTSSYVNPATKDKRPNLVYEIESPDGRKINHPTHAWKFSHSEYLRHKAENRLWWGNNGTAAYPRLKNFLNEMSGMVPVDLWHYQDAGTTDDAGNTLKKIFGTLPFDTPKPTRLIEKILRLVTDKNSLILDAFAGSGTTAHAVINLNAEDGGNRKFILIEAKDYCRTITAERVKRVGGTFRFYRLGATLFDNKGALNPDVTFQDLAAYVWSKSTKTPYTPNAEPPLIGIHDGAAYYVFNEVLTSELLKTLPTHEGAKIIFATACRISAETLESLGITFQQIPKEV